MEMQIKILGTGCKKCRVLEENVKVALQEMSDDSIVEKVEDIKEIVKYRVMSTPALVIDEKVISTGKVLTVSDVKKLLI